MRTKNYDELSEKIFNEIGENLESIQEILVGDTFSPALTVIKIDIKSLLHKAVLHNLSDMGAISMNNYNCEGYSNGLATDFEEIKIRKEGNRMMVYITRDEIPDIN